MDRIKSSLSVAEVGKQLYTRRRLKWMNISQGLRARYNEAPSCDGVCVAFIALREMTVRFSMEDRILSRNIVTKKYSHYVLVVEVHAHWLSR